MTLAVVLSVVVPFVTISAGTAAAAGCTTVTGPVEINAPGCYELAGGTTDATTTFVTITASNVTLEGNGHVLDGDHGRDQYGVYVKDGHANVTIRNLTVSDWTRGIYVVNGSGVRITDVTSLSNGFGFYVFESSTARLPNGEPVRVRLTDLASRNDQRPIRVEDSQRVDVSGMRIAETTVLDVEYLNTDNSIIRDVTLFENASSGIIVEEGVNVTVTDNRFRTGSIQLRRTNRSTIAGNTMRDSPGSIISVGLSRSHNNTVANNVLVDTNGISVSSTNDLLVRNNTVVDSQSGIVVSAGRYGAPDNFTIADNVIRNSSRLALDIRGDSYSVGPASLRNGRVLNNTLTNGSRGLRIYSAANLTLRNTTIAGFEVNFLLGEDPDFQDESIVHFRHNIDSSNTVEGEPIRYIRGADGVTIEGGPAVQPLVVVDSTNVTIRDRRFANQTFLLANASDTRLSNLTVEGTGFGVHYSSNVTVESSTFGPASRYIENVNVINLVIRNSRDVTVTDSVATSLGKGAVLSGGSLSRQNENKRVTLRNFTYDVTNFNRGIEIDHANDTRILDSTIDIGGTAITIGTAATDTLVANTSVVHNDYGTGTDEAIDAVRGTDTILRNNTIRGYPGEGIWVRSPRSVIEDNLVTGHGESGIRVDGNAVDAVLDGNVVRNNERGGVFVGGGAVRTVLVNNTIADNDGPAGVAVTTDFVTLHNNTIRGHRDPSWFRPEQVAGILARSDLKGLTITGGRLVNNTLGIGLGRTYASSRSTGTVVSDVAIRDSDVGVYLWYTRNNTFRNLSISDSAEWAFYAAPADGTADNNTVRNVTIDDRVRADWRAEEVGIARDAAPPRPPANHTNVGGYLRVLNTTAAGYADLTVSYADANTSVVNESTLALWRYNESWAELPGSTLTTATRTVAANVTAFGVIAPLGEATGPIPEPDVAVVPVSIDFGSVVVGRSGTDQVTITNNGTADLTVTDVSLAGGNADAFAEDGGPTTLAPGGSVVVNVTFTPGSTGVKTTDLVIETDDFDENRVNVTLTGTGATAGTPDIAVTPVSIDFGSVAVGASASDQVTITNEGTANLSVSNVAVTGANASAFATGAGGFVLAPGGSRTVSVTFTPASNGTKTATLTVTSDDPDETPTVALTGSATATTATVPNVTVSSSTLDFGTVGIGTTATRSVTIANDGTADLLVTDVSLTGVNATMFAEGMGGFALAPGESRRVGVTFAPVSAGSKTAELVIASDDPDTPTTTVGLIGTGATAAPNISVAPAALAFGDVRVGATATLNLTVTNTGTGDLLLTNVSVIGPAGGAFSATAGAVSLAPNASTDVTVSFTPAVAGDRNATLVIDSDDADRPRVSVALTGSGLGAGDVTGDGTINTGDVIQVQRFIVGLRSFSSSQLQAADVTDDGTVNTGDVIQIQRFIVGLSSALG